MKYLKKYKSFESYYGKVNQHFDFISDIGYELSDDGFIINETDFDRFMEQKYKNISQMKDWKKYRQELKELKDMDTVCLSISISKGVRYDFNTYDVESPVSKLISYFTELGYSSEVRKIIMYSRKSIDVTNSFKRKMRENKRDIITLQLLFKKDKNENI